MADEDDQMSAARIETFRPRLLNLEPRFLDGGERLCDRIGGRSDDQNAPPAFWMGADDGVPAFYVIARTLGTLGEARAIPKLCAFLDDERDIVRLGCVEALGALGPRAIAVIDRILPLERDGDDDVSAGAQIALRAIRGER